MIIKEWQNVAAHIPVSIPPVINSPGQDEISVFEKITPKGLLYLNQSKRLSHAIPDDVLVNYRQFGRPTPLIRAKRLEEYLGSSAKIFLKREDVIPTGSFKLNTALAQASRAKQDGYEGVVTETGAGQWGLAISAACALYRLKCRIFMARCSYQQKPLRRQLMEFYGSEVYPSPSSQTNSGRKLSACPEFLNGSIGTAISEAIEFARDNSSYAYVAGSNMHFVYVHQSVMGLEAVAQLKEIGEQPDTVMACVGGGSNLAGFALPFRYSMDAFTHEFDIVGCESSVIPRLTKGKYKYDHSDPAGLTPLGLSFTLGKDFMPPPTHIGGLRQHNASPLIGALLKNNLFEARAYTEEQIFRSGQVLAQTEGIIAAPESCHGIAGVIEEATKKDQGDKKKVIVSCVSGSGIMDFAGFASQLNL